MYFVELMETNNQPASLLIKYLVHKFHPQNLINVLNIDLCYSTYICYEQHTNTFKQQIKAIDNNFQQEIPGQVHSIN